MALDTTFVESRAPAEFILQEGRFHYSRDNIVVKSGEGILLPGTVMAKLTQVLAAGTVVAWGGGTAHANTGNGTCTKDGTTPIQPNAEVGDYLVVMTDATNFTVYNPNGESIGAGVAGTAFVDEIKFTVATSTTPFVAGDGFKFPVTGAAGGGEWVKVAPTGSDGSQTAAGIVIYRVDATSAAQEVSAIVRHAQVNGQILIYPAAIEDAGKKADVVADLEAAGIIVR